MSDPRVYFAAERTLLAWIRTGIAVVGLGFVVARFGFFLSMLARSGGLPGGSPLLHGASSLIGILLVIIGAGAILGAVANHASYVRALPPKDVPPGLVHKLTLYIALAVAVIALLLAAYLGGTS